MKKYIMFGIRPSEPDLAICVGCPLVKIKNFDNTKTRMNTWKQIGLDKLLSFSGHINIFDIPRGSVKDFVEPSKSHGYIFFDIILDDKDLKNEYYNRRTRNRVSKRLFCY